MIKDRLNELLNEHDHLFGLICRDVTMTIIAEKFTPKFDELDPMIAFLKPTWIFPIHYGLPPLAGIEIPGGGMTFIDKFLNQRRGDPVFIVRHHTVTFSFASIK